jgi:hypothetical protein
MRRRARRDEREDDHEVITLDEAHDWNEKDRREPVERIQRVAEQRDADRRLQQVGPPRRAMQLDDRLVHPPRVPKVLQPVAGVGEQMRGPAREERLRQRGERDEIDGRGSHAVKQHGARLTLDRGARHK